MLDIIREEINSFGESINMDPNIKESTKEYYAYVKELFSDVRLVKAAGAADIIGAIHFINKDLSNDELFQRYRMIKEIVNKQLILAEGEKKDWKSLLPMRYCSNKENKELAHESIDN